MAPEEKKPSPVLVGRTNKKGKHENKFSASFHQLTASRGQLSFKMWCTPSFGPPPELFTQQGGTKERKRHPRFRGTRCLNCIKIHRKLTSQHNSKGLAAHLPSPFVFSLTTSLSLMVITTSKGSPATLGYPSLISWQKRSIAKWQLNATRSLS